VALNLQALLKAMTDKGASDLHVTAGSPPRLRIDGDLVKLQTEPLTPVDTKTLCYSVMNDAQKLRFEEDLEIDFSFGIRGMARFRANVYMQQTCVAGAFRVVPYNIIPLENLGMPPVVTERGSDRVPALAQELPRQPARDRPRQHVVQARAQVHPAPGSRRRADR
jgi:twitching motility protein PilT